VLKRAFSNKSTTTGGNGTSDYKTGANYRFRPLLKKWLVRRPSTCKIFIANCQPKAIPPGIIERLTKIADTVRTRKKAKKKEQVLL
jgi:Ubiquitin carboxyl-terminal hydrolase